MMKAVILAGGKGTRLKPYTTVLPKPLMPVGDVPILEVILRQLKYFGINDIIITVGHLAGLIQTFFGSGKKFGVHIEYFLEDKPLGTIGSFRHLRDLGEDFIAMNGDILTDLKITRLIGEHLAQSSIATIATYKRNVNVDFGVMRLNDNDEIIDFYEKPTYEYNVSTGVYAFNRRVIDCIPDGRPFGFDELINELLRRKECVRAFPHNGYWLDLGRPEDYETAIEDFSAMRGRFLKEKEPAAFTDGILQV